MAALALACYAVYFLLAMVLRTLIQRARTGSTGFRLPRGALHTFAGGLFSVAVGLGFVAPLLVLWGRLSPLPVLDGPLGHGLGLALVAGGLPLLLHAQLYMGASWRVGVDEREVTRLVTGGPFGWVRNPIFSAMVLTQLGLALLSPSALALAALALLLLGLEVQIRLVEEPYLLRAHGQAYADYAARVGRFVPGLGRLRPRAHP